MPGMPLTLGLNVMVKRKPQPAPSPVTATTARAKKYLNEQKVSIGNPKEDSEVLLRRVMDEMDVKLLPGGDGFNCEERIKKERFLTLVDRLFDSDTALAKLKRPTNSPPDCYLLVFSGPAVIDDPKEDGAWLLDDKVNDKIFPEDILDRWVAARHFERGAVLYILSDSDKSGTWIEKMEMLKPPSVFVQASCGSGEVRGHGKHGQDEQFLKGWCLHQLGLANEDELEMQFGLLGQAGVSVFKPFGFNFPPIAWTHNLRGLGEEVELPSGHDEMAPLHAFLNECLTKAEQLQPLTNMPVGARERPRLLQSPEDMGISESKRKERALLMALTSPPLRGAALTEWGKPERPSVLLTPEDLTEIAHILRRYVLHEEIAVSAVQLLWRLSWHEEYRAPVVNAGAIETVFKALELHVRNTPLVCAACGLACRVRVTPGFRHKVLLVRGLETLVMAMRSQEDKADVQRFGCVALNVIASPPDPPLSHEGAPPQQPLPLSVATVVSATETCIAVLEGRVSSVAEVAIAAMGAAQGMLRLDLHPKQPQYEGNGLPPREDSCATMEAAVPKLIRGISKVLLIHASDPAVMRQACQLLDAIGDTRYKSALSKVQPQRGEPDYVLSLLEGINMHKDRDDVAWQLLSTLGSLLPMQSLKNRMVANGARQTVMAFPKQRVREMPRWLEDVYQSFQNRISQRD